jgi:hypothetical protein
MAQLARSLHHPAGAADVFFVLAIAAFVITEIIKGR